MKALYKLVIGILSAIAVIWTATEYLTIPAILIVIGLLCEYGWEFYVISLGSYVFLVLIIHLIGFFADKVFEKTAEPVIEKKLDKLFDSITQDKEKES